MVNESCSMLTVWSTLVVIYTSKICGQTPKGHDDHLSLMSRRGFVSSIDNEGKYVRISNYSDFSLDKNV